MKKAWVSYVVPFIPVLLIVGIALYLNPSSPSEQSSPSAPAPKITTAPTYTYKASFTNQFGTATTICAHSGCSNYIASSGDTNCCTTHSNMCAECGKYIDEDALLCMDCIEKALD